MSRKKRLGSDGGDTNRNRDTQWSVPHNDSTCYKKKRLRKRCARNSQFCDTWVRTGSQALHFLLNPGQLPFCSSLPCSVRGACQHLFYLCLGKLQAKVDNLDWFPFKWQKQFSFIVFFHKPTRQYFGDFCNVFHGNSNVSKDKDMTISRFFHSFPAFLPSLGMSRFFRLISFVSGIFFSLKLDFPHVQVARHVPVLGARPSPRCRELVSFAHLFQKIPSNFPLS